MIKIDNLTLFYIRNYIDVGFDDGCGNNIFAIKHENGIEEYILRIWGSGISDWLDEYGVECVLLPNGYYGVIIEGVDDI